MRRVFTSVAIAAGLIGLVATGAQAATPQWRVTQTNNLPGYDGIYQLAVTPGGGAWSTGYRTVNGKEATLLQHLTSKGWKSMTPPKYTGALSASSDKNVWTFGGNLAYRWNGKRWSSTTLTKNFVVWGSLALSPTNVWALGGATVKYADHWNGRKWSRVAMPATATIIKAVSPNNLWATGMNGNQPTMMHWNGKAWSLVKVPTFTLPDPDSAAKLYDIVALSATNVWAVGAIEWECDDPGFDSCNWPITLHWNGHTWTSTEAPKGRTSYVAATADGSGGLWILDGTWDPTLVHEVNGKFTSVPAPRPAGYDVYLDTLASRPRTRTIWAAGTAYPTTDGGGPSANGVYLRNG